MKNHSNCLKGWHVVILRPEHQAQDLEKYIRAEQGTPILLPTIRILPIENAPVRLWVESAKKADFLIVSSPNAMECAPFLLQEALANNVSLCVLTMGKGTSAALEKKGVKVFYTPPSGATSETLLAVPLMQKKEVEGKSILLLAGEGGRTLLEETLQQRGGKVIKILVYRQTKPDIKLEFVMRLASLSSPSCFIATSLNMLENLLSVLPAEVLPWLQSQPWIVPSERIAKAAKEQGFKKVILSEGADNESLAQALQNMVNICCNYSQ